MSQCSSGVPHERNAGTSAATPGEHSHRLRLPRTRPAVLGRYYLQPLEGDDNRRRAAVPGRVPGQTGRGHLGRCRCWPPSATTRTGCAPTRPSPRCAAPARSMPLPASSAVSIYDSSVFRSSSTRGISRVVCRWYTSYRPRAPGCMIGARPILWRLTRGHSRLRSSAEATRARAENMFRHIWTFTPGWAWRFSSQDGG